MIEPLLNNFFYKNSEDYSENSYYINMDLADEDLVNGNISETIYEVNNNGYQSGYNTTYKFKIKKSDSLKKKIIHKFEFRSKSKRIKKIVI